MRKIGYDWDITFAKDKVLIMKEKRRFERFQVYLSARMEPVVYDKKQIFELRTRDISASGAFIDTKSPFSEGTRVKMTLTTENKKIKELTGAQSFIECEGVVIRSTPQGMALCFDKECQILSLKS